MSCDTGSITITGYYSMCIKVVVVKGISYFTKYDRLTTERGEEVNSQHVNAMAAAGRSKLLYRMFCKSSAHEKKKTTDSCTVYRILTGIILHVFIYYDLLTVFI